MNILRIFTVGAAALLVSACAAGGDNTSPLVRERAACADVGIAPGTPEFTNCVGKLDQAMSANGNASYH
jgi:hypothetical protein